MQKGARIEVLTRNSRLKAAYKKAKYQEHSEWKEWHVAASAREKDIRRQIKAERTARREDWLHGALAPNRDHGTYKGAYGTVRGTQTSLPNAPKISPRQLKLDGGNGIAKGIKDGNPAKNTMIENIIENDRVVIVEGPERLKGLIGTVAYTDKEAHSVVIKNINSADVRLDYSQREYSRTEEVADPPMFRAVELPMPIINVRLVTEVLDPATGRKKPVIIRHLHAGAPYSERTPYQMWPTHTRYATGTAHLNPDADTDLAIEWPEEFPYESPRQLDADSSQIDAESQNWYPDMDHSPLCYPTTVIETGRANTAEELTSRYIAGKIPDQATDMSQVIGMHGFADSTKLKARQNKIAAGIYAELKASRRPKHMTMADEVKRKLLEDARAIWWSERQVLSPPAEAAKKAHEERRRLSSVTPSPSPHEGVTLSEEVQELATQLQAASMKDRYEKPDKKMLKKIRSAEKLKGVKMDVNLLDPKLAIGLQSAQAGDMRVEFV